MFIRMAILLLIVLGAGGCNGPGFGAFNREQSVQGPQPLIPAGSFEKIDLALQLDPDPNRLPLENEPLLDGSVVQKNRERLREAFTKFYRDPGDLELRRNRLQERILAASAQRCGEYKQFLKRFESESNLFLGALTTITAGMGAIFTAANTVRALSGAAAIASGLRSEVNDTVFMGRTIQVITDGFELRRRELYEKMTKRQQETIDAYPVEAAIRDAIQYHDACSLNSGLEAIALSVERAENPGLKSLLVAMEDVRKIRELAETPLSTHLTSLGTGMFVDPLGPAGIGLPVDPYRAYAVLLRRTARSGKAFEKELEGIAKSNPKTLESPPLSVLKSLLTAAVKQTTSVLKLGGKEEVKKKTIELDKLNAALIATIDDIKANEIRFQLRIARTEAKRLIFQMRQVYNEFQSNIKTARKALEGATDSNVSDKVAQPIISRNVGPTSQICDRTSATIG